MSAVAVAASIVPSSNRGLKCPKVVRGPDPTITLAIVDFLTFTAPWTRMVEGLESASPVIRARAVDGDESSQLAVAEWIIESAFPGSGLVVDPDPRGFRNFYERHFRLVTPDGNPCGFVAMGGERQRGTVCVELTGSGCAHVKAWAPVVAWLDTLGARITRVDVAHDDFEGLHGLADAERWHAEGAFNSGGRPPAIQHVGWDDGSGKTVYIGKNVGNQQLCVYEKGRQQGARDGDPQARWVRWEGRFGAKYRDIPTTVLLEPASYLVGHFPALRGWLQAVAMRMRTSAERAAANLSSAIRHAKRQTGALFHLAKRHIPDRAEFAAWVEQHVVRERLPAWLSSNPFGAETIHLAFQPSAG